MKIFGLNFIILTAVAVTASASTLRHIRDVGELAATSSDYLPPSAATTIRIAEEHETEIPTTAVPTSESTDSAIVTDNGYEYRTVRRLKLRHRIRRDVSHLQERYLPPKIESAYLPPDQIAEVPSVRLNDEYLPPVTEAAAPVPDTTEAPIEEPESHPEYEPESEPEPEAELDGALTRQAPEDTTPEEVVTSGGYHYEKPAQPLEIVPQLHEDGPGDESQDDVTVVEGPAGGESAILDSDGYHYRTVKLVKF